MAFFAESILEYTVTGKVAPRRGNRHKRHAPQGCYPRPRPLRHASANTTATCCMKCCA